jgi:nucleoside-diphosphate-sugar epimerase
VVKVLVTGAGGFIGSHLVEDQLARGRAVQALDISLDRLAHRRSAENCSLITGDIRDAELLKKIIPGTDIIFHLASAHLEVNKAASFFWTVNVDAVKSLLDIAHQHGVKRFVHCSSVGVYGPLARVPADEETACHPDIPYEETKLAGEKAVHEFARSKNLDFVILRPAWVYGPRCPRTLRLFRTIKKRRFVLVGDGQNFRHPTYIADVLDAFELAATKESVVGKTFVIAAAEPIRLRDLVKQIAELQGVRLPPVRLPLFLMKPVCASVELLCRMAGREPPVSRRSLKFFTEDSAFDISKARKQLGYSPSISLHDGLARTQRYYREEGLL